MIVISAKETVKKIAQSGNRSSCRNSDNSGDKRLAIVLDDRVPSAPEILEKILGGSAQISGSFLHEEATDLAVVPRVGASSCSC